MIPRINTLADLRPGGEGFVRSLGGNGFFRERLLDLGFVPGTRVRAELIGPFGDPVSFRVRDTAVALRLADAGKIEITVNGHHGPGLDRGPALTAVPAVVRMHDRAGRDPVVVLAGNPNTGKSTVFNALTGLRQHVGNWPGKTVGRAAGAFTHDGRRLHLVDLPGTYSLLSLSPEEEIARDVLVFDPPDCTVVVVDATRLERNLNLVFQILEITPRSVICLNLVDEAAAFGLTVDDRALERRLGVPVVATVARSGHGLDALREQIFRVATEEVTPSPLIAPLPETLDRAVSALAVRIAHDHPTLTCPRWIALRLLGDGDPTLRRNLLERLRELRKVAAAEGTGDA